MTAFFKIDTQGDWVATLTLPDRFKSGDKFKRISVSLSNTVEFTPDEVAEIEKRCGHKIHLSDGCGTLWTFMIPKENTSSLFRTLHVMHEVLGVKCVAHFD